VAAPGSPKIEEPTPSTAATIDADGNEVPRAALHDYSKLFVGLVGASKSQARAAFLKRAVAEVRRAAAHVVAKRRLFRSRLEETSRDAAEILGSLGLSPTKRKGKRAAAAGRSGSDAKHEPRPDPLGGSGLRTRGDSATFPNERSEALAGGETYDTSTLGSTLSAAENSRDGVVLASSVPLQQLDAAGRVLPAVHDVTGGTRVLPSAMHLPTASVPLAVDLTEVLA